jgi:hypothetical protein
MKNEREKTVQILNRWNQLIANELDELGKDQLSALSSWVVDCYESYTEICDNLDKILQAPLSDYDLLHDCVVDIFWELNHIKKHIESSEEGFEKLMKKLATKAEDEGM